MKNLWNLPFWGALAFSAAAWGAPFSVTYTDTVQSSIPSLGIVGGEQATIELVLDNGGSSTASQTWSAANVQCAIFNFNAGALHVAFNYAGSPFSSATTGSFTTNGASVLQTALTDWSDFPDPITAPTSTNITGATPVAGWTINGNNNVIDLEGGPVSFTNVANDIVAADWSNPVTANGLCAALFTPTVQFTGAAETSSAPGTFSIPITLSSASASAVTVPFSLGGSAVAGTDYSGVTASPLVIPAGQTAGNITGTLILDPSSSKTLTFTLGTPTGATLGGTTVNTLTITESLTPNPPPISTPTVGAGALVMLALLLLGFGLRRRAKMEP